MKFLFVVQGEGRGHLTQAIALREMLLHNGHEVVGVLVGKSNLRELPAFFLDRIHSPLFRFESPNFQPSSRLKKPNILKSFLYNMFRAGIYFKSSLFIRKKIKELDADVVINFYELLVGLTYFIFPPKVPYVCVAHQYILLHPEFKFPKVNRTELFLLKFFTKMTCIKSSRLLALSFRKMENIPSLNICVVPPLLRKEVLKSRSVEGDYIHGYLLNNSYADEIIRFQKENPEVKIHFFWDKKEAEEETVINDHLTFHKLNDQLFIDYMASCRAFATTAGFESVCEAMYLGKPVLMVPTHVEQACNAYDAAMSGAGIVSDTFDLKALSEFASGYYRSNAFRYWVQQAEWYIMGELNCEAGELLDSRLGYSFIFEDNFISIDN